MSFFTDHLVKSCVAKFTYGITSYVPYDFTNVEHRHRLATVFVDSDGVENVQHAFSCIMRKVIHSFEISKATYEPYINLQGTEVLEVREFRGSFFRNAESPETFPNPMTDDILSYRGTDENPQWTDINSSMSYHDDPIQVTTYKFVTLLS